MAQSHSLVIERPIARVFAFAEDPEHAPRWAEGIVRFEPHGPVGQAGSTYTLVIREGRAEREYAGEVVAWEHEARTRNEVRRDGMRMVMERRYGAVDAQRTRITMSVEASGVPLLVRPLAALMNRVLLRRQLAALKRLIEAEA